MALEYDKTPWRNDQWYTSFWNFDERSQNMWNFADQIKIHDVTLRDGEQQSRVAFTKDQKVAIAQKLDEVGMHRIEAGMPAVSRDDYEAIEEMLHCNLKTDIFCFARCMVSDAKLAADLGVKGVVMEIPANELLIKYGYRWETEKAIASAVEATKYAHERGLYVVLFMIDFSRASFDYATNFVDAVNRDGHFDALTCVDTQGALSPLGAYCMVRTVKERYPDKKIEFHGHAAVTCAQPQFTYRKFRAKGFQHYFGKVNAVVLNIVNNITANAKALAKSRLGKTALLADFLNA